MISVKSKKLFPVIPVSTQRASYQFALEVEVLLYLAEGLSKDFYFVKKYKTFS